MKLMEKFVINRDINIVIVWIVNGLVSYYKEEIFFCWLIVIKLDLLDFEFNIVREGFWDLKRGKLIIFGK